MIVGGGPAGVSTALHIVQRAPHLRDQLLILEAATYPRPKLCGGGITVHGETQLQRLNLQADVPAFAVHRVAFRLGSRQFVVAQQNAMRIIQRKLFDAALADAATQARVRIRAGEKVVGVESAENGYLITTSRGRYHATVLVAADGAASLVRRKLKFRTPHGIARLLRVLTPIDRTSSTAWQNHTAMFDFSCVAHGVQGYVWDFPCYMDGAPMMNRGIFDSRIAPRANGRQRNLKTAFATELTRRKVDLDSLPLRGHPVRWFDAEAEFSRPHLLLVGDAAGVDPLFAEGISYALEYGAIAAEAIVAALESREYGFGRYRETLLGRELGRLLARRTAVASALYAYHRPILWAMLWRLAAVAPARLQRLVGASLALLPA